MILVDGTLSLYHLSGDPSVVAVAENMGRRLLDDKLSVQRGPVNG